MILKVMSSICGGIVGAIVVSKLALYALLRLMPDWASPFSDDVELYFLVTAPLGGTLGFLTVKIKTSNSAG